jgi:hypothetical protein
MAGLEEDALFARFASRLVKQIRQHRAAWLINKQPFLAPLRERPHMRLIMPCAQHRRLFWAASCFWLCSDLLLKIDLCVLKALYSVARLYRSIFKKLILVVADLIAVDQPNLTPQIVRSRSGSRHDDRSITAGVGRLT